MRQRAHPRAHGRGHRDELGLQRRRSVGARELHVCTAPSADSHHQRRRRHFRWNRAFPRAARERNWVGLRIRRAWPLRSRQHEQPPHPDPDPQLEQCRCHFCRLPALGSRSGQRRSPCVGRQLRGTTCHHCGHRHIVDADSGHWAHGNRECGVRAVVHSLRGCDWSRVPVGNHWRHHSVDASCASPSLAGHFSGRVARHCGENGTELCGICVCMGDWLRRTNRCKFSSQLHSGRNPAPAHRAWSRHRGHFHG